MNETGTYEGHLECKHARAEAEKHARFIQTDIQTTRTTTITGTTKTTMTSHMTIRQKKEPRRVRIWRRMARYRGREETPAYEYMHKDNSIDMYKHKAS